MNRVVRGGALAMVVGALLAGCAGTAGDTAEDTSVQTSKASGRTPLPTEAGTAQIAQAALERPGCYTVDLFDPPRIVQPGPDVPESHARWVGAWGGGVWGGSWCHDIVILSVDAGGRVELLDLHAPSEEFGQIATAYRRVGRLHDEGTSLRFAHGVVVRRYDLREGKLHAKRSGSGHGELRALMSRKAF